MIAAVKLPDPGEEQGWAYFREVVAEFWREELQPLFAAYWEWAKTPLGATVSLSVLGAIIILGRLFKR